MGHLERIFIEKVDKVSVQTDTDQGHRVAKVTRLLSMLGYIRA